MIEIAVTAADWAARIGIVWRRSAASIIETGQLLIEAKAELPHGEWLKTLDLLDFPERMAQRLIDIGRNPKLANPSILTLLPGDWTTIHTVAKLDDETLDARIADGTIRPGMNGATLTQEIKMQRRADREQRLGAKQNALPDRKFGVIVADPEWRFEPWSRSTGMDRAADNHYPTSCLDVIKSRDVPSIAADDCFLGLWATIPMLPHALVVMAAWDFDYKSHYCWGKDKRGTGYWNFEKHELFLIGTRGDVPCPTPGSQGESFFIAPRGRHSEKPECVLEMIEAWFPHLPRIELNRRGPARPGWQAWGNETILVDVGEVPK